MIQFHEHIFQSGWFNCQLDTLTTCFGKKLLRPVSWWWILCGHEHLCIPTSEVTSRMKREPARQADHLRSRRIFFPHFCCHRKGVIQTFANWHPSQQIAGILWRICGYGPVSIDSHPIFEKQTFHDCWEFRRCKKNRSMNFSLRNQSHIIYSTIVYISSFVCGVHTT